MVKYIFIITSDSVQTDELAACAILDDSTSNLTLLFFPFLFMQLADAMELMLLSILSPAVKCQWGLSSGEEAAITSVLYIISPYL